MTCGLATALEPPHFNHAPAWGATAEVHPGSLPQSGFNPRTRVGCDGIGVSKRTIISVFQSTHPRGVRRWPFGYVDIGAGVSIHAPAWGATRDWRRRYSRFLGFNPRTRVGCDTLRGHGIAAMRSFQSTHPRGVRHVTRSRYRRHALVSIHAPAWGATFERPTPGIG